MRRQRKQAGVDFKLRTQESSKEQMGSADGAEKAGRRMWWSVRTTPANWQAVKPSSHELSFANLKQRARS
jgi:hypothetical protein